MEGGRRIFVTQNPLDLTVKTGQNCVYVLELPISALGVAGRRIDGIGQRKARRLDSFELPRDAAGIGVTIPEGPEKVVTGVVDAELVDKYDAAIQ
jgi:hypothetical protein